MRHMLLAITMLATPAHALEEQTLIKYAEQILDFVSLSSATCVSMYPESMKAEARAKLNFSPAEISAYCACSTKLLIQRMSDNDIAELAATGLPARMAEPMRQAKFECARKVWEAPKRR